MKTVKEVSRLAGVSVRALHHYDAIGLLKPTRVTEAGYRLYDNDAMKRLQTILLFRQLQFPLKKIRQILDAPEFDPGGALEQQIRLLTLQKEHLEQLIRYARQIQKTGVIDLSFSSFNKAELERYTGEALEKWGASEPYQEYAKKTQGQSREQMMATGEALMDIFAEFGKIRSGAPDSREAQSLVAKLKAFITENYYTCTNAILRGLGELYIAGDDMTRNIDRAGGEGTAEFVHDAIAVFCE